MSPPCLRKDPGPAVPTFRQYAQGLVRSVPADMQRRPGSGAVTGHTGALLRREGPLGGRGRHRFPLDLLPGRPDAQATSCPAVEGQRQEEPLGWIQYALGVGTNRHGPMSAVWQG